MIIIHYLVSHECNSVLYSEDGETIDTHIYQYIDYPGPRFGRNITIIFKI